MTPQSKILLVFFLCVFIVAVVLIVVFRKKKEKVKKKVFSNEVNRLLKPDPIDLDPHELKISQ